MLKKMSIILCLCLTFTVTPILLKAQFKNPVLLKGNTVIYTSARPGEPLYLAVVNLQLDIKKVLGKSTTLKPLADITVPGIVIATANKDSLVKTVTGWEAHHLYVGTLGRQQQLILEGADMRGTIYAVYTFSERVLGVPPL